MKSILTLLMLLFSLSIFSQNCNCESNFNWVKKTFEENDAGYAYALEKKGEQAYLQHNETYNEKIKTISSQTECLQTIYQWLTFFRSGHIEINSINQQQSQTKEKGPSDQEILDQYKDWEKFPFDLTNFTNYIESKKEVDYEGIWVSEPYTIGIKKVYNNYVGFIIEADGAHWSKGQIKLRIIPNNSVVYYMRDHSAREFENVEAIGNNYLQLGFITLKRISPKFPNNPKIERYFNAMAARDPYFEMLDKQTAILRIPNFAGSVKPKIDSVIAYNRNTILSTKNLIIDIRNNGGGSDRSYHEILPLIYTDTIRTLGVEFRSTPLNNQRMSDFANKEEYAAKYGFNEEDKKEFQEYYDILSNKVGEFVNLDSTIIDYTHYDTIYPYPLRVGIIINENNASTAEQFLLAAKQSEKVKLFGTTTFGALDISNMYFVDSPCEEFQLGYCLSKSYRIPKLAIDEVGIQPDYFIDDQIPHYDWVDFVGRILNK